MPALAVLGGESLIGDGNFALAQTATGVRAEKSFPDGLRLIKNFQLSSNFLVLADVRLAVTDWPVMRQRLSTILADLDQALKAAA